MIEKLETSTEIHIHVAAQKVVHICTLHSNFNLLQLIWTSMLEFW